MKKTVLLFSIFLSITLASAQTQAFEKNDNTIQLGVGFSTLFFDAQIPALSITYERSILHCNDKVCLGVGGFAGTVAEKGFINRTLGAQASAHYSLCRSIDVYSGVYGSYSAIRTGSRNQGEWTGGVLVGSEFLFSDRMGVFLQAGGFDVLSVGFVLRL